jgi:Tyrosine-protein kinase ephrin type A/B receptor-like
MMTMTHHNGKLRWIFFAVITSTLTSACKFPGEYFDRKLDKCVEFEQGFFGYGVTCPPGHEIGLTKLKDGDYNTWIISNCNPCDPGEYQNEPFLSVEIDPQTRAMFMPPECKPCPEGSYNTEKASPLCLACPINTYQPGEGAIECFPCPPGMITHAFRAKLCDTPEPNIKLEL